MAMMRPSRSSLPGASDQPIITFGGICTCPAALTRKARSITSTIAAISSPPAATTSSCERYRNAVSAMTRHHTEAMSLHLTQIRRSFGGDDVLLDVSAIVRPRDRVALVGRNGAGKTTLLRIIAGELDAEGGSVSMTAGMRVALHDQRPPLRSGVTLGDYVGEGAAAAARLEGELRSLERRMADGDTAAATLAEYGRVQAEFERAGGYAWRSRLEGIARGLGFSPADLERQLETFSGGELTRASLTRALAGEPDLLLLDEPTNHLDVDSIEWLEEYLDDLDASVMFVSHDRWFLESVANAVLELDRGKGRYTKGSYSHWRKERAERMAAQTD